MNVVLRVIVLLAIVVAVVDRRRIPVIDVIVRARISELIVSNHIGIVVAWHLVH